MGANETYKRRIANHECTYCGCKLPESYTLRKCEECNKQFSEIFKYARGKAEKNGLCTICKARKARPGRKTCAICADKINKKAKARRDRLKAAGLCIICGKVPRSETSILCNACKIKWKGYSYGPSKEKE